MYREQGFSEGDLAIYGGKMYVFLLVFVGDHFVNLFGGKNIYYLEIKMI